MSGNKKSYLKKMKDWGNKVLLTSVLTAQSVSSMAVSPNQPIQDKDNEIKQTVVQNNTNSPSSDAIKLENVVAEMELIEQAKGPCNASLDNVAPRIGDYSYNCLFFNDEQSIENAKLNNNGKYSLKDNAIHINHIEINTPDEYMNYINSTQILASAIAEDCFQFNIPVLSDDVKKFRDEMITNNDSTNHEYNKLNFMTFYSKNDGGFAQAIAAYHEFTHGTHNAQNTIDNTGDSPYMATYVNVMTEKIAKATEILTFAQMYTTLKENGIDSININNEMVPADRLLDFYPGIDKVLKERDFSLNDPKCINDICEFSSKYWDQNSSDLYILQSKQSCNQDPQLVAMIYNAKNWDKRIELMGKNIQVLGAEIDLTQENLETLAPPQEHLDTVLNGKTFASNEDLLKLDDYLNSIGLKNTKERAEYINKQSEYILSRSGGEIDKNFLNGLIECSSKNGGEIVFVDGIKATFSEEGNVVLTSHDNKITTTISKDDFYSMLDNAKNHDTFDNRMAKKKEENKQNINADYQDGFNNKMSNNEREQLIGEFQRTQKYTLNGTLSLNTTSELRNWAKETEAHLNARVDTYTKNKEHTKTNYTTNNIFQNKFDNERI